MDSQVELLLKISSIVALASIGQWIVVYTRLERWQHSYIGRSLVLLAAMSMVTPALFILSLFFDLNRGTSQALGWAEIVLLFAYAPAMIRRSVIWTRVAKGKTGGRHTSG